MSRLKLLFRQPPLHFINPEMTWTDVVKFLILTNVTVFAAQEILGLYGFFITNFALIPAEFFSGKIWTLFTYMFLHGGFSHILFNMLALWMFGSMLERVWGAKEFLKYYLITGLGGGLCYALFNMDSMVPTVGASGAIYGLLLAYAVLFPDNIIYIWFVIPIKARYFAIIFGVIEFLASFNPGSGVAHLAHLGGMVMGYVYLKWGRLRYSAPGQRMREWKRKLEESAKEKEEQQIEEVRREVDELLDKINNVGMDGLSKDEQQRLEKASKFLREKGIKP
ncbi:MAG: rhomboid family intramembrane serine protease [Calditrichaeota bacterium]|nr:rhomboid family intramembrane serine protease [Calditrichota bacterium]